MIQIEGKFKTLADFLEHFKDEETCHAHFVAARFRNGEYCPHCGHNTIYRFNNGKRFRCQKCKQDFTIRTGTIFGESKLPLKKWFIAIYLLSNSNKGMSSVQLAKHVGVTQKTAWFMDHRIREAMKQGKGLLSGTIEMDETYVGGKEKNKHLCKRTKGTQGRSTDVKVPVLGMVQRGGEIRATCSDSVQMRTVEKMIVENAAIGSTLHTDEFVSYSNISKLYHHEVIAHAAQTYVRGDVHTNTIESFWALFKRCFHGTYHMMSRKHLQRYVNEVAFRWNERPADLQTIFADVVQRASESHHLSHRALTKGIA